MNKTKTFICMLSMTTILSASPAFAVVEMIKVLQYSLRNVQATIEVVKNAIALGTSIQQTTLQGTIGAVAPRVMNLGSKMDVKSFAPSLPSDLQSIVGGKSFNAIPQVRSYVDKELKSIRLGDGLTQRDVLHKLNELQNQASLDAIQIAKETLAKSNKGAEENKAQLNNVASAKDAQAKASQETAQSIQTLQNDVIHNQLSANVLLTKVTEYKGALVKATQTDEVVQQLSSEAEASLTALQNKISETVKNPTGVVENAVDGVVDKATKTVTDKAATVTTPIKNIVDDVEGEVQRYEQQTGNVVKQVTNVAGGNK